MKTSLRAVLKKNVGAACFILMCLLFASIVLTAKVMADRVLSAEDELYYETAGKPMLSE